MKKTTNWDLYFQKQMGDPEMKGLIEEEIKALRIGTQLAKLRQRKGLSQTQLAAKVGMSAPNISRIESSPSRNLTLETMLKLFGALNYEVSFKLRRRRSPVTTLRAARA
jgi:transcriptional regulator with XRE-family HTH domain